MNDSMSNQGTNQGTMTGKIGDQISSMTTAVKDQISGVTDQISGMTDKFSGRLGEMKERLASDTAADHSEGGLALPIETMTAKLPSDTFLWAALGSIGTSLALFSMGRKHDALFVGQWAPTFLILGLYNKIVKVAGHDRLHRGL